MVDGVDLNGVVYMDVYTYAAASLLVSLFELCYIQLLCYSLVFI